MSKRWIIGWVVFAALWTILFYFSTIVGALACSGDGGEPYAAPASPLGHYCNGVDTVGRHWYALWIFAPLIVTLVGVVALAFSRRRLALAIGAIALIATLLHAGLSLALPATCSPDDESAPGCSHY